MDRIQVSARFAIQPGKFEEFAAIGAECVEIVQTKDSGTLQYDWFYNEGHDECVVRETYVDSDALLEHIEHVGEHLGRLIEISEIAIELYGDPSEELLEASASLPVTVYHFHGGA